MLTTTLFTLLSTSTAAYAATCQSNGGGSVPANSAQSCVDSIRSRGSEDCTVDGENTSFCTLGGANVYGSNTASGSGASSAPCTDVADAAQAVIDECKDGNDVAGFSPVSSNGNIIISLNP